MISKSLFSFAFYLLFYASRCFGSVDQTWGVSNLSLYHPMNPWLLVGSPFTLEPRQVFECSVPGGPMCSATTCCRPGQHCCLIGCCNDGENCQGNKRWCCPQNAQTCGGTTCCESGSTCCSSSPTGCCVANAVCCGSSTRPCCLPGSTCCGNSCCPAGETCERGECIDASLNITRLEYDEEVNGDVLRNMCNGMRGKNTGVVTYSGPQSRSVRASKRRAAGCKSGYCANLIRQGLIDSRLNSCDEYPPASTEEGGGALYQGIQRTFNCVPGVQNSWQGTQFRKFGFGTRGANGIKQYEKVVISIDCDKVLGSFRPPQRDIVPRDVVSQSGNQSTVHHFSPNDTTGFLIVPFGDLAPGTYSSTVQLISGSTINGTLIDSYGDNYTDNYPGLQQGDRQQFNFTLDEEGAGMGLVFFTTTNSTNITWTLGGTTSPTSSISSSPTGSTISSISSRVVVNAHFLALSFIVVSLLLFP